VAAGVSRSFQIISVFQALTVFENVRIAVQAKHPRRFAMLADAGRFGDLNDEALRLAQRVGLGGRQHVVAANLSHGDQRLLEIGIALATHPELLLLDEPLAGLAAPERVRVADLIRELRRTLTIVLIEHDIDQVLALACATSSSRRVTGRLCRGDAPPGPIFPAFQPPLDALDELPLVEKDPHHLAEDDERPARENTRGDQDEGDERPLGDRLTGQTAPGHVERQRHEREQHADDDEDHADDDENAGPEGREAVLRGQPGP
jgi:hypothetical protein